MSERESAKVVVIRCVDMPNPEIASVQRQCGGCGANCWASKSTAALEEKYDVTYSCQVCSPPQQLLQTRNVAFLESQRAELETKIGSWGVTMLLRKLGIREINDES